MKNNQRGEILTIVALTVAATLLVASAIPSINVFGKIFGGSGAAKAPTEEVYKEQRRVTEPVMVGVLPTGEKVIAFKETQDFKSGASKGPGKLTYGERIAEFFSGLTNAAVLVFLGLFLLFGITPAMVVRWFKNRDLKRESQEKQAYEQTLTRTVSAIRKMPEDAFKVLEPILKDKHDLKDKQMIDKIKMTLHA